MEPGSEEIVTAVRRALAEDIGSGDATTDSIFSVPAEIRGDFVVKSPGVLAGLTVAALVFSELDSSCTFSAAVPDGSVVTVGSVIASITGPAKAVLSGERTALNFLQRMSGIATQTRAFVEAVKGTGCVVLDTRKTAPGLRVFDKLAVRTGGGRNHRAGLFDMVLIKDNHIDSAGSITEAVRRVRSGPHASLSVEVECRTLDEVREALNLGVDRILLDNMDLPSIVEAVKVTGGRTPLEVSGNVTLSNVRPYAETGIQFVSVGSLTHSARAMDISLTIHQVRA